MATSALSIRLFGATSAVGRQLLPRLAQATAEVTASSRVPQAGGAALHCGHLSAGRLGDGEALVVLSRRTGASGPVPKAMVIEGTLAGAPFSQRFELPTPASGAGYLPRLWARAQVEADIRAGAEAHKAEITALGMEHFLVTPFTSLLVLENEAMYRQFKVRRPSEKEWAHYDAPAKIKVVKELLGAREPRPARSSSASRSR